MRAIAFLALLAGAGAAAAADKPWMGFSAYPGARELCSEHVTGKDMHITWRSFAVADEVTRVVAFYEKDAGRKSSPGDKGETRLALDADRTLAIYPAAKSDAFPHCAKVPAAAEKTVILVSTAVRN